MANRNVKNRHSALTQYVNDKWRNEGVNQATFVHKLFGAQAEHFGSQTLSKFIHGRLASPPDGLLTALAKTYPAEYTKEQLQSMAHQDLRPREVGPSAGLRETMHFVAVHNVWAATFIAAMLDPEDGPQNVKFATLSETTDETAGAMETKLAGPDCGAPVWVDGRTGTPTNLQESGLLPLSTHDVIKIVRKQSENNQLVFGLLPGQLMQKRVEVEGSFVKLATLSVAACVLIVPAAEAGGLGPDPVTSSDVANWLRQRKHGADCRVVVLAERGTVAAEHAMRITSLATQRGKAADSALVNFTSHDLPTRQLVQSTWEDIKRQECEAVAIVAWEPQASWFIRRSQAGLKSVPLMYVPQADWPAEQMTVNIYLFVPTVYEGDAEWCERARRGVDRLWDEILPMVQAIQDSVSQLFVRDSCGDLERLGTYFGSTSANLSSQQIQDIFGSIRFGTYGDPCGIRRFVRKASHGAGVRRSRGV